MLKSNVLLKTIQKEHPSVSTDSFALTEEENSYFLKKRLLFKSLIVAAKKYSPIQMERKTFSVIQAALSEKEPWNHKENTSSFYDTNSNHLLVVTAKMSTTTQMMK